MKKEYPHIKLCLKAPYLLFFSEEEKKESLKKYDRIEITPPSPNGLEERISNYINDMINKADFCVCYVKPWNNFLKNEIAKAHVGSDTKILDFAHVL